MKRLLLGISIDLLVIAAIVTGLYLATRLALPALVAADPPPPTPRRLMAGPPSITPPPDVVTRAQHSLERASQQVAVQNHIRDLHAQASLAIENGNLELAEILLAEARLLLAKSRDELPADE